MKMKIKFKILLILILIILSFNSCTCVKHPFIVTNVNKSDDNRYKYYIQINDVADLYLYTDYKYEVGDTLK